MNSDKAEGTVRDFRGKIQDAAGGLTGDAALQARGKANQVTGSVQSAYGQAVAGLQDFATEQPLVALASALGIGVIVGWLLRR